MKHTRTKGSNMKPSRLKRGIGTLLAVLVATTLSGNALAQKKPKAGGGSTDPVLQSWMSPEVGAAWSSGYRGQGITITIVDDFTSGNRFWGNLGHGNERLRHGEWTRKEAGMIAPSATLRAHDFYTGRSVPLNTGFNVLNLSYGMMGAAGWGTVNWSAQESSIIRYASEGRAVVAKAAGNDAVAVGQANAAGNLDYLNRDLIGKPAAIFVGALSRNGTTTAPAALASYSNFAGANATVQNQFLVVGVDSDRTGLAGTSFAAPIVSGYAAIVASKFTAATPTQVVNQLLTTARQDTVQGYNAAIHGRGEASITRALSPQSIQ
jgi:subtilisin family serine protease